jgi:hypothetical protein
MLGLGSNLMYPESALFGDVVLDVSGAQVTTSIFPTPDDEGVTIVMTFFTDTDNVYTAMGLNSPIPDTTDIGNKLNGTFDFTVTRYTFGGGGFSATTDTATVTGKVAYAASLIVDNVIAYISVTDLGSSMATADFQEGGSGLFDLSSLGGDITDSSVLNNAYVVQATYTPPSGFTGTVTTNASQPTLINPGPS